MGGTSASGGFPRFAFFSSRCFPSPFSLSALRLGLTIASAMSPTLAASFSRSGMRRLRLGRAAMLC